VSRLPPERFRTIGEAGGANEPGPEPVPLGHILMFWTLLAMGFATLAPCVLLPVWNDLQRWLQAEQTLTTTVAALQADLARGRRIMDALRTDPAVNERLAMRELGYERPDVEIVDLDPPGMRIESIRPRSQGPVPLAAPGRGACGPAQADPIPPQPAPPFAGLAAWLERWLPDWPWSALFCQSRTRYVMLAMSLGLIAGAFILYSRDGNGTTPAGPNGT